jgi:hypothetical protein
LQRVDENDESADRHEEQPTMMGRMTDANRVDAELLRTAQRSTKLCTASNLGRLRGRSDCRFAPVHQQGKNAMLHLCF